MLEVEDNQETERETGLHPSDVAHESLHLLE